VVLPLVRLSLFLLVRKLFWLIQGWEVCLKKVLVREITPYLWILSQVQGVRKFLIRIRGG
jgi:hypothetical protein